MVIPKYYTPKWFPQNIIPQNSCPKILYPKMVILKYYNPNNTNSCPKMKIGWQLPACELKAQLEIAISPVGFLHKSRR